MTQTEYEESLFVDPSIIFPADATDQQYLIKSRYSQIAQSINAREISIYNTAEFETGQVWPVTGDTRKFRRGFRKIVALGNITAAGTQSVAHNASNLVQPTNWWGYAYESVSKVWYRLPYSDPAGTGNVSIGISSTSVIVTAGATTPTLTLGYVIIEYLKE